MALLYPWATKEYLLWHMTIGQVIMYHNIGIELKYPSQKNDGKNGFENMSHSQRLAAIEKAKENFREQYGDV